LSFFPFFLFRRGGAHISPSFLFFLPRPAPIIFDTEIKAYFSPSSLLELDNPLRKSFFFSYFFLADLLLFGVTATSLFPFFRPPSGLAKGLESVVFPPPFFSFVRRNDLLPFFFFPVLFLSIVEERRSSHPPLVNGQLLSLLEDLSLPHRRSLSGWPPPPPLFPPLLRSFPLKALPPSFLRSGVSTASFPGQASCAHSFLFPWSPLSRDRWQASATFANVSSPPPLFLVPLQFFPLFFFSLNFLLFPFFSGL